MGGGPVPVSPRLEAMADKLSMSSHGSMVEINSENAQDKGNYKLIWSKSSVFLHPSQHSRDNIGGHVCLLSRIHKQMPNREVLLAWIPDSLATDVFEKVEAASFDGDDMTASLGEEEWMSTLPEFTFCVPVSSIYSLIVRTPTLTCWYGSVTPALFGGNTLPTLYFHDDESASTVFSRNVQSKRPESGPLWGGQALLAKLSSIATLHKSSLEPTLFLVNPSKADLQVHSGPVFDDLPEHFAEESVPAHLRPRPISKKRTERTSILHESLSPSSSSSNKKRADAPMGQITFSILNNFSKLTRTARQTAKDIARPILSHNLAKPIVPHLTPPIQSLAAAETPEFTKWMQDGGVHEYNQAAVFLAKWARVVAEEGERLRRAEIGASADGEESSALGAFEILAGTYNITRPRTTRAISSPIIVTEWESWFSSDNDQQLMLSPEEARKRIFQRGLDMSARTQVWPFLLGIYPWKSTATERQAIRAQKQVDYESYRSRWWGQTEVTLTEQFMEERHRIEIDCRRTDRNQPLFSAPPDEGDIGGLPNDHEQRADYEGGQPPSNVHVRRLQEVLLTYNQFETDLGYVQGMSDLAAPIYICMDGDASLTFWCFVAFMERAKPNFLRDQSGMKTQLSNLQKLIALMDPTLYAFLEKADSMNLFFCFRWILIYFKREFPLEEVLKIWENLMTDVYGSHFHLFVALAILEAHRDIIMRYLQSFDEVLSYINQLSMTMEAEPMLCQAEILYLTFRDIVERQSREKAYMDDLAQNGDSATGSSDLRQRKGASATASKPVVGLDQEILSSLLL